MFPSARGRVAERAAKLEVRLFERFVSAQLRGGIDGGCTALSRQRIAHRVPVPPEQLPAMETEHLELLTRELKPAVRDEIAGRWVAKAGSTVAPDFGPRLTAMITDGELGVEFDKHLTDCLRPVVRDLRDERATNELRTKYPTVENRTFQFASEAFVQLARNDEIGRGRHFPDQRGLHLEETDRLFEERRSGLVAEARRAFDRQMSLVDARKEVYEARVADTAVRTDETLQALRNHYVSEVDRAWNDQRPQLLDVTDNRYSALFSPAEARIVEILKLEWQRPLAPTPETQVAVVQQPRPQAPPDDLSGAESGTGGHSGSEGLFSGEGEGGPGTGAPQDGDGGGSGGGSSCKSALAALQNCPVALRGCTQALAACRACAQGMGLCIWEKGDCLAAIEICEGAQRTCK